MIILDAITVIAFLVGITASLIQIYQKRVVAPKLILIWQVAGLIGIIARSFN